MNEIKSVSYFVWKSKAIRLLLLLLLFFSIPGCGGSRVLYKPDFSKMPIANENLKRGHTRVYQVIDERDVEPHFAGIAQTGLINRKVPYELDIPVSEFVGQAVSQMIDSAGAQPEVTPITIHIEIFEVYEKTHAFSEFGYFDCRLRFVFPITADSFAVARISSNTSVKAADVTASLKNLINDGIAECTRKFIQSYYDRCEKHRIVLADPSSTDNYAAVHAQLEETETSAASAPSNQESPPQLRQNLSYASIGVSYYEGNKVESGIDISYDLYRRRAKSQFHSGLGYALTVFKVTNMDDWLEGQFVNFGIWIGGRYYFSETTRGFYLEGNLKIGGGTESLDYGYEKKEKFFLGPIIEEKIGLNLFNVLYMHMGLFQVKLFGSKLLPEDTGYSLGLRFGL